MRYPGIVLFVGLLVSACGPAATPVPTSTASQTVTPPPAPTASIIAENPPACAGANMVYHPQLEELLLVGCVPMQNEDPVSVVWGWNGEQWRRVTEGGPAPRVLGAAAYDEKRNVLVLYGGYSLETETCGRETWEWDGERWSQIAAEGPTACDHVRMVYDVANERIVLFGGGNENNELIPETWSWDGEQWMLMEQAGPPGRAHFGLVYDDAHEQILLYGGYAEQVLDDFWSQRDGQWQSIDFPGPGTRSHFGMALEGNALLIFGGASSTSTFSSLTDQTWRLTNGAWSELNVAERPSPRGSPAMAYDPQRGRIVLYGGFAANRQDLSDTWEWDGSAWQCLVNCQ